MWPKWFIFAVACAIIALLSAFYLGLITLAIFVLAWCIIFIPPQLDTARFLRMAKNDAYALIRSTNPNPARIDVVIKKLNQHSKDKEVRRLIQELQLKLEENCTVNTVFKCGSI
jgi:hypothetical protein